jgi:hypothetical protein
MGDGVQLGTAKDEPYAPMIMTNGAGGAIVTWYDSQILVDSTSIYAQLVDASGAVQWTANASALCATSGYRVYPNIASDGAGGAIVAWFDYRSSAGWDIYAQRVNQSGTAQWVTDGDTLCSAAGDQEYPSIVSDGVGGAIVAWQDARNGNADIYALRIGPGGVPTAVGAAPAPAGSVMLSRNYPNPFATETTFEMTLRRDAHVTVEVFDAAGRRVRTSHVGHVGAGSWPLAFHATDDRGRPLASGVYFYRVRVGGETVTRKILIAR